MDAARQQLFAGAGFTGDEHRQVVRRHTLGQGADGVQRAVVSTDHALERRLRLGTIAQLAHTLGQLRGAGAQLQSQALVVLLQPPQRGCALQGEQQLVRVPGLEQVLPDAGFVHPGDDVLRVSVAGEDHAHRVGPALADLRQQRHAAGAGHALVG